MKSASRLNVRIQHEDKYEILYLQKENANLRSQLKLLSTRLNELIQLKDLKSSKKKAVPVNPEEELKDLQKMLEIYKIEKKSLSKRLKKTLDLNYYNDLLAKVEKSQKELNTFEVNKKNSELFSKKENLYKQSPSKPTDSGTEIANLNNKIGYYKEKIHELEDYIEKNLKILSDSQKKHESLEKEHKSLMDEGEPYFKEIMMKKLLEKASKKKHIEQIIQKESSTKSVTMLQKIKTLQMELNSLRDTESSLNHRLLESSKQIQLYTKQIKRSPISFEKNLLIDNRSRSVKPLVRKLHANDISYF